MTGRLGARYVSWCDWCGPLSGSVSVLAGMWFLLDFDMFGSVVTSYLHQTVLFV